MKYKLLFFLINLAFFTTISISYSQRSSTLEKGKYDDVLLKEKDMPMVLNDLGNDASLQLEWTTSYLFHKLLNQYRVSQNLKPLAWNNNLWLAARNHSVYMANNKDLDYDENRTKPFFTGVKPLSRIFYVLNRPDTTFFRGYTSQIIFLFSYNYNIEAMAERAMELLKRNSFINKSIVTMHGASLYIDKTTHDIYFSLVYSNSDFEKQSIELSWSPSLAKKYKYYPNTNNESAVNTKKSGKTLTKKATENKLKTSDLSTEKQLEDWNSQLLKEEDLPRILNAISTDSALQLERLSSYYFHQLINKYRIEKKTTTLYWDERLWLAARNHNLYQAGIADIDHTEQVKNDFFSGKQPEDRVKFVTYNMEEIDGIGENVLYNYDKDGETVEEIALNIAKAAFLQWRNSPPHNANMLDDAYFSHGTSLYISNDGKVFGTTVFAFKYDFEEQEITLQWDTALAKRNPSSFSKNGKSYDKLDRNSSSDEKKLLTLVKKKMPSAKKSLDKGMQLAAQKQINYLKSGNEKEKNSTPKKRYLKATKYKTLLYVMTHKIQEKSFNISCTEAEIKNKSVFAKIDKELQTQFSQRNKIQKWGAAVAIIEKDKQYKIMIDVVWVGSKK